MQHAIKRNLTLNNFHGSLNTFKSVRVDKVGWKRMRVCDQPSDWPSCALIVVWSGLWWLSFDAFALRFSCAADVRAGIREGRRLKRPYWLHHCRVGNVSLPYIEWKEEAIRGGKEGGIDGRMDERMDGWKGRGKGWLYQSVCTRVY